MSIIKNYQPGKGTCKVTFTYPTAAAVGVKTIQVLGDFNNWDAKVAPKMKSGKEELSAVVELAAGKKYEFRYLLDGTAWDNDHSADGYIASPYGGISNSVIVLDGAPAVKKAASAKAPVSKAPAAKAPAAKAPAAKVTAVKPVAKSVPAAKPTVASKPAVAKAAVTPKAATTAKAAAPKAAAPKAPVAKAAAAKPAAPKAAATKSKTAPAVVKTAKK